MSCATKVALVTGSTRGIGLSCAQALAKRGVNIIATGSTTDKTLIDSILADFRNYGVQADYVAADLSKVSDIETLWSEVMRLYPDGIDILINNAGIQHRQLVEEYPEEKWDYLVAVLLSAPFHLTKRCIPVMKKKGWGRIVNISSVSGVVAQVHGGPYSACKHGLHGLTKAVALETAAHGITCNAVCPGWTETRMYETAIQHVMNATASSESEAKEILVSRLPTKKVIQPDQVAELVEFLCLSGASSQMTGATYLIDHGYSAQ